MLEQKKAKLLNEIYRLINQRKGTCVAESFLQHLLNEDLTSRSRLNNYFDNYIVGGGEVILMLQPLPFDSWVESLDDFVMDKLIDKYEQVRSWQVLEKNP